MISIVICSRNSDISSELKDNIAATIGCEYELVVVDNSTNKYSIFQAYNEGACRSKGEVICFIHDDIAFHSDQWGGLIESLFASHGDFGAVGVLGGHLLPSLEYYYLLSSGNILQLKKGMGLEKQMRDDHFDNEGLDEVAVLDGLFFAIPKTLFENDLIQFDETFPGFHAYDLDICMQVRRLGAKCVVTNKILVEHRTEMTGVLEGEIFRNSIRLFYEKWDGVFPVVVGVSKEYIADKYADLYMKLESVHFSHAYKLGKCLWKPLKKMKSLFK